MTDQHSSAGEVVTAMVGAFESGDVATAFGLLHPDVHYVNMGFEGFEIRGREAYGEFLMSLQDFYTEERSHEILGIDAYTPTMANLRLQVTVRDVTGFAVMLHSVKDGRVSRSSMCPTTAVAAWRRS